MFNNNNDIYNKLLSEIASEYSTPCYVYNKQQIIHNFNLYKTSFESYYHQDLRQSFNYLICYAVKANSNIAILHMLAKEGAGFDIVSIGELHRVLKAGGDSYKIVFSGVGKQDFEIKAALEANILCFNVESEPELILINQLAKQLNKTAPVSIRVNPNIDAKSHPYISTGLKEHKFGIAIENAANIYLLASSLKNINITGIDCHIGSQLTEVEPLGQACLAIVKFIKTLNDSNISIKHINMGGGLGIAYKAQENIPSHKLWIDTIINNLNVHDLSHRPTIIIEPGRSIIGNAGILLSKVIYTKTDDYNNHSFIIIDAAMNDLMRPALYSAEHDIINLTKAQDNNNTDSFNERINNNYNTSIVGPVCESSDVFLKNTKISASAGDLLAIKDTGAYGFSMSSNYNSRPRAAEILIDNGHYSLIRKRETIEDLDANETILY